MRQTDFRAEAVGFLADRLNRLGVEEKLLGLGAEEGDTVLIEDVENAVVFDFRPMMDAGAELLSRRGEDQRFEVAARRAAPPCHRRGVREPRGARVRADVARRADGRLTEESREHYERRVEDFGWDENDPGAGQPPRTRPTSRPPRSSVPRRSRPGRTTRREHDHPVRRGRCRARRGERWESSSLTTAAGGIDPGRVRALVDTLAGVRARRRGWCWSSGAIAAGLAPLGLTHRPRDLATQQAAASVGQGLLVHRYTEEFARHGLGVGQVLLTVDDMTRRSHYRNAYRTFAKLLELGVLPIVNENDTVATGEIRFGDNDRLAALVAHLVHAELLLLLSDVDGLYDGHPDALGTTLLSDVTSEEDLDDVRIGGTGSAGVGTGGMQTKVEAARIATGPASPSYSPPPTTPRALAGDDVGTMFHPTGRRRPTRLLWLAHATEPKGQVVLDEGASAPSWTAAPRCSPPASPACVARSSAATPWTWSTRTVCRGTGAGQLRLRRAAGPGRPVHELARELGSSYEAEVVHRDDLVLLHRR